MVFHPRTAATGALGSATLLCYVSNLVRPVLSPGVASLPAPLTPSIAPPIRLTPSPLDPLPFLGPGLSTPTTAETPALPAYKQIVYRGP